MNDFKRFSRKLNKYEQVLKKELKPALKQSMVDVREKSSSEGFHRYKTRSGMLNKAYVMKVISNFKAILKLTKRETNTPYAWAIHSGRPDWRNYKPDLFLYRAAKNKGVQEKVYNNIKGAIKKARRVFNGRI